jgi:hypothetical protein
MSACECIGHASLHRLPVPEEPRVTAHRADNDVRRRRWRLLRDRLPQRQTPLPGRYRERRVRYGERPKSRFPEPALESVLLSRLSGSTVPGSSGFTGCVGGIVFPAVPGGGNGSVGVAVFDFASGAAGLGVVAFGVAAFGVAVFGVAVFGAAAPGAVSGEGGAGCAHGSFGFAARCGAVSVPDGAADWAHGSLLFAAPGESRGGAFAGLAGFDAGSVCSTGIALGCRLLLPSRLRHAPSAVAATNAERTSQ